MAGLRFNPPPGWPPVPPGFTPEPGWLPDPAWPPPPPGWQLWVEDSDSQVPADPPGAGYQPQPGSWPMPGQQGPGGWEVPGRPAGISGWTIASFVLGLISCVPLSVIFGIIGLRRIRKTGQGGKGFAIAGLALSGFWVLMLVLAIALAAYGSKVGNTVSAQGGVSPYSLKVGDCFDNPAGATRVLSVALIPCSQAHNAQVFATFKLTGPDLGYPGDATARKLATNGCVARNGVLDRAKVTSAMKLRFILPGAIQWLAGKRAVICLAVNPQSDLTSSLLTPGASG